MNYFELQTKIKNLSKIYDVRVIGKSRFNRNIYSVEKIISNKMPTAILVAGTHAREHITTDLVIKLLENRVFDDIFEFNVMIVPMLNPDGIELCVGGLTTAPMKYWENLIAANGGDLNFSLWKSNGFGVDLNNNFDAGFGEHVSSTVMAPQGFAGKFPESEPETQTLVNFTKIKNTFFTISYHSKGEEIYFNFFQDKKRLARDTLIAQHFAFSTGYKIKNLENSSSGGFKDWCVQTLKIPSLTIEIGSDELVHPISSNFLGEIYLHHKEVAKDLEFAYNVFKEDYV